MMIKKILLGLSAIFVIGAAFMIFKMTQPLPDELDLRTEKPSDKGVYMVSFFPTEGEPEIGPIAIWHLKIADQKGEPVTGAKIEVDGGMPQHGHGLPTAPAEKGELEPGIYKIDGVKFSMSGWWELKFKISANAEEDTVTFNRVLK